ncbi:hypothetical protein PGT21_034289 [Puccinia graminis f. sp. tritici]|uniref:Uncharacterized protein n=1 Tax=Puccinia graminis f. sp. tritici TaxID=56615 RepID=A0A5B0NA71_PUCGR|nr:hypothetical protein PGTUg99_015464 [Puccinia graminis f. sp. tritici]KAA1084689.1 hypothetical protein PGT21_034289 [Puccinia graminis f. sp. tritici]
MKSGFFLQTLARNGLNDITLADVLLEAGNEALIALFTHVTDWRCTVFFGWKRILYQYSAFVGRADLVFCGGRGHRGDDDVGDDLDGLKGMVKNTRRYRKS